MSRPRVLVAHEEEAIRNAAMHAVESAGYEGVAVADGASALALLVSRVPPAALVVDVGLRGMAGYELCDVISQRGIPTKVVLIASVYSKTAYKRRPTSLYGADDYVEQHHVVDLLAPKLAKLVPAPMQIRARSVHAIATLTPDEAREFEQIRERGDQRFARERDHSDAVEHARQLARLVVSDLVLYSGGDVESWLGQGGALEARTIPPRLSADLDEARQLFNMGVAKDVAGQRDFVLEALMEFLEGRG